MTPKFDEAAARKHAYDLEDAHRDDPDYHNDTYSIIEGARWQFDQLAPELERLREALKLAKEDFESGGCEVLPSYFDVLGEQES